jgi:hypothetical protein
VVAEGVESTVLGGKTGGVQEKGGHADVGTDEAYLARKLMGFGGDWATHVLVTSKREE